MMIKLVVPSSRGRTGKRKKNRTAVGGGKVRCRAAWPWIRDGVAHLRLW